jgi:hypothetical protein
MGWPALEPCSAVAPEANNGGDFRPDPAWYTGCSSRTPMKPTPDRRDSADFSEDLSVDPGQALASLEQEVGTLGQGEGTELQRLEQLLTEARRAVQADAGTIFLRHSGATSG